MKTLLMSLTLAVSACQASAPLDAFPQLELDAQLVGTWRCIPVDADETDEAWVSVSPHATLEGYYAVTWRDGGQADEYEAFASSVGDSTILNAREADASRGGWTFVRYGLLRDGVLLLEVAREELFGDAASSSDVRAALEGALAGGDSAFEDPMVCVGGRKADAEG